MVSKDRVDVMNHNTRMLTIFSKYGMDNKYNDPFIYELDDKYGLVYSFLHDFYGHLTRVVSDFDESQMDEFLYCYWWYKKYGEEYHVSIELDDYESLYAQPHFMYLGREIKMPEMKQLLINQEVVVKNSSFKKYQRVLRTAQILIEIISLKLKTKFDTQENVFHLKNELVKQENEFLQLYNRYQKDDKKLKEVKPFTQEFVLPSYVLKYQEQYEEYKSLNDDKKLKDFVDELWKKLLALESEKKYLKDKYTLIQLPLLIDDVRKKKEYMESLFNKKKGFFSKKEHVKDELMKIDAMSETLKIVKMEDYIENEVKRIQEKYSVLPDLDYGTLGDYLSEFDNLDISISLEEENEPQVIRYSKEEFVNHLEKKFDVLSSNLQDCLTIYHSFMEPICDEIVTLLMKSYTEPKIIDHLMNHYLEDIKQAILILSDVENVFVRMKKMKLLSLTDTESFLISLIEVCKSVLALDDFRLPFDGVVFGKSMENNGELSIYHASCKTIGCPSQNKGTFEILDVITVPSNSSFCYFPTSYVPRDPYFGDYTLEEEKKEDILLLFKHSKIDYTNSKIVHVSRYKIDEREDNLVKSIRLIKTDSYRHVTLKSEARR